MTADVTIDSYIQVTHSTELGSPVTTLTKNSNKYIEREKSWLAFNARVLQEAADDAVPLLDRLRFLGIFSNNLDAKC